MHGADMRPASVLDVRTFGDDGQRKAAEEFGRNVAAPVVWDPIPLRAVDTPEDERTALLLRSADTRSGLAADWFSEARARREPAAKLGAWAAALAPGSGVTGDISRYELLEILASRRFEDPDWALRLQEMTTEQLLRESLMMRAASLMVQWEQYRQNERRGSMEAARLALAAEEMRRLPGWLRACRSSSDGGARQSVRCSGQGLADPQVFLRHRGDPRGSAYIGVAGPDRRAALHAWAVSEGWQAEGRPAVEPDRTTGRSCRFRNARGVRAAAGVGREGSGGRSRAVRYGEPGRAAASVLPYGRDGERQFEAVGRMFFFFAAGIFGLVGVILIYQVVYGVMETGRRGLMGFSGWGIVRLVVVAVLLAPIPFTLSSGQWMVVGLAGIGADFAQSV